jgi:hypothetical protein
MALGSSNLLRLCIAYCNGCQSKNASRVTRLPRLILHIQRHPSSRPQLCPKHSCAATGRMHRTVPPNSILILICQFPLTDLSIQHGRWFSPTRQLLWSAFICLTAIYREMDVLVSALNRTNFPSCRFFSFRTAPSLSHRSKTTSDISSRIGTSSAMAGRSLSTPRPQSVNSFSAIGSGYFADGLERR